MKKEDLKDIYYEMYSKYGEKLNKLKRKSQFEKIFGSFLLFLGVFICETFDFSFLWFLLGVLLLGSMGFGSYINGYELLQKEFDKEFRESFIKNLINKIDENYTYIPNKGMSLEELKKSTFIKHMNHFYSKDFIEGNINNTSKFKMSQIEVTVNNGEGGNTTVSFGLFGIITLPIDTKQNIEIYNNYKANKYIENRVELESQKFEKHYDVFSEDRKGAMELLTPKSIEILNDIRDDFKNPVNIVISGKYIYFKLECGELFGLPELKQEIDYNVVYRYFNIVTLPKRIYDAVSENILIINGNEQEK